MAAVVQAHGLTKSYGSRTGVADLGFSVDQGEVFGYLGPNGAGKTTTIRLILDLIRPTNGRQYGRLGWRSRVSHDERLPSQPRYWER